MASKYVPVKKEDTYALIQRAQQGDRQACEQIVSQNTGLDFLTFLIQSF